MVAIGAALFWPLQLNRWFLHTGHFCIELAQLGPEVLSDHNKEVAAIEADVISYSRKLLREKTFVNFKVLWLFVEGFSMKFGGVAFL